MTKIQVDSNGKAIILGGKALEASEGIVPTGTISITANGVYDVTNYTSADVSVSGSTDNTVTYIFAVNDITTDYVLLLGNVNTYNSSLVVSTSVFSAVGCAIFCWQLDPNTDYSLFYRDYYMTGYVKRKTVNISIDTIDNYTGGSNN